MRPVAARQAAEAQQAQQTQDAGKGQAGQSGKPGFAGGTYRGQTYRNTTSAHQPAKRNTGPAPKPRRPPSQGTQGAHHEDEHPPMPTDDPRQMGANAFRPVNAAGAKQQQGAGERQEAGTMSSPPRARLPPPMPEVREGAALRRSKSPEAALLAAKPSPEGTPVPVLLGTHAALYFKAGDGGSPGAERLAVLMAVQRHLPPDAPAPTMGDIRAAAIARGQVDGPPPARTDAQRDANVLYPLHAFRAMTRLDGPKRGIAEAGGAMLQRALNEAPTIKEAKP